MPASFPPLPRQQSDVWFIGDSITANGYTAPSGANGPIFNQESFPLWAHMLSGARLRMAGIAATGGYTSAQVLSTHVPTVLAQYPRPGYCSVLCGTNDVPIGDAAARKNLLTIYQELAAAGITPVPCTLTPRNDTPASSTGPITNLNTWIARTARLNGWPCVDFWAAVVNPANSQWTSGYNIDNVHPQGVGSKAMGQIFSDTLSPLIPLVKGYLPTANYWTQLHNQNNALLLTDTNADGLADGYAIAFGTGVPTTPAMSGAEGLGNWQALASLSANYGVRAANAITLVPGNRCLITFKFKTAGIVANSGGIYVRLTTTNLDNDICSVRFDNGAAQGYVDTAVCTFAYEFIVPSGMSTNNCQTTWDAAVSGVTLSVGQIALIDLTANGLT